MSKHLLNIANDIGKSIIAYIGNMVLLAFTSKLFSGDRSLEKNIDSRLRLSLLEVELEKTCKPMCVSVSR